jgi:hypothetical protein
MTAIQDLYHINSNQTNMIINNLQTHSSILRVIADKARINHPLKQLLSKRMGMIQLYIQNQISQKVNIEEVKICNLLLRIYPTKILREE